VREGLGEVKKPEFNIVELHRTSLSLSYVL
jgi:hypothetical protein